MDLREPNRKAEAVRLLDTLASKCKALGIVIDPESDVKILAIKGLGTLTDDERALIDELASELVALIEERVAASKDPRRN